MEKKMDALFDLVQKLSSDMTTGFVEVNKRFEKIDNRLDAIDVRFDQVDTRFDQMQEEVNHRFDTLELKLDNVITETRNYIKRSEDRINSHHYVLLQLSYKVNEHDGQITEIRKEP